MSDRLDLMSRRMIPVDAAFSSPVRESIVYITECTATRILPACTRSATRGSGLCCASVKLVNVAVKITMRSKLLMRHPKHSDPATDATRDAGARHPYATPFVIFKPCARAGAEIPFADV